MISQKSKAQRTATPLLDGPTAPSAPVERILEVFQSDLRDVSFPDVSAEILQQASETVRRRAAELEALHQQLTAARSELQASQAELRRLAERGLAYARVYAVGSEELAAKVDSLAVSAPPARKRRKTKAERTAPPATEREREDDTARPALSMVG